MMACEMLWVEEIIMKEYKILTNPHWIWMSIKFIINI